MSKQLAAAAAASVVALIASWSATAADWRTYDVAIGGFSIGMPSSWTAVTADQLQIGVTGNTPEAKAARAVVEAGVMKLFVSDSSTASSSSVNVGAERIGTVTLGKFADATAVDLRKTAATVGPVALSHVALPAGAAISLDWKTKQTGQPQIETVAYILVRSQVAYELSYTAPVARMAALRPVFTRSAKTFRYLPAPDLSAVALKTDQIGAGYVKKLIPDGDSFIGTTTLDICTGPFPSERLRTGRLQNDYRRKGSHVSVSNEVVTYVEGGAQQALAEAKAGAAECIAKPRVTKRGANHATLTMTKVELPNLVPGSLAVKIEVVGVADKKPFHQSTIAVYQVRGNTLSGVYVSTDKASGSPSDALGLAKSVAAKSAANLGTSSLAA